MSSGICRWGILGTAGIARKNWMAIKNCENAQVNAVASRGETSAQTFIDECSAQVPQGNAVSAVASYQGLLDRDDVDAVYIPLPTALRHEWVIKAAEAGKHVICEKPAALNASQVEEMIAACKSNQVQYMDGVMFMHSDRLPVLRELLDNPDNIGTLRRLSSGFSFAGDEEFQKSNIRTNSDLEPYGCLGDLGWYCSRMFMWILNGQLPTEVRARILTPLQGQGSPAAVPGEFSAELLFPNGVSANFYNSFITENQQWIHASGTKGNIRIDDFVLPYHGPEICAYLTKDEFTVDNCLFHMEHHQTRAPVTEYDANMINAQETKLFANFSNLVLSGQLDDSWPEWTLKTQKVLDACFASAQQDGKAVQVA